MEGSRTFGFQGWSDMPTEFLILGDQLVCTSVSRFSYASVDHLAVVSTSANQLVLSLSHTHPQGSCQWQRSPYPYHGNVDSISQGHFAHRRIISLTGSTAELCSSISAQRNPLNSFSITVPPRVGSINGGRSQKPFWLHTRRKDSMKLST